MEYHFMDVMGNASPVRWLQVNELQSKGGMEERVCMDLWGRKLSVTQRSLYKTQAVTSYGLSQEEQWNM